jgi:hypothetical protein
MESGFQSLIYASATLLGLVLVALVFAYQSAFNRIENIGEFRHFAKWVFAAGFSCFVYYACCLLVGFRLSEDETSRTAMMVIAAVVSAVLLVSHYLELKWGLEMAREDWRELRPVYWIQSVLVVLTFLVFEVLTWTALISSSIDKLESITYTAFSYTLVLASLRAVVLVGSSFWSIMVLSRLPKGMNHT